MLRIFAEPILYLRTHRLRQTAPLNLAGGILWLTGQAHVNPVFRIRLSQSLILRDVTLDCLPADTNSAGYLPLTFSITIYSLVPRSFWNSGESLYSSLSTEFMSSVNVILPLWS